MVQSYNITNLKCKIVIHKLQFFPFKNDQRKLTYIKYSVLFFFLHYVENFNTLFTGKIIV